MARKLQERVGFIHTRVADDTRDTDLLRECYGHKGFREKFVLKVNIAREVITRRAKKFEVRRRKELTGSIRCGINKENSVSEF